MSTVLGPVKIMFGPCWDHVWPKFTSRQARALELSRLIQHDLRDIYTVGLLLCLDHVVGSMLYLALLLHQLKLLNFEDSINMV